MGDLETLAAAFSGLELKEPNASCGAGNDDTGNGSDDEIDASCPMGIEEDEEGASAHASSKAMPTAVFSEADIKQIHATANRTMASGRRAVRTEEVDSRAKVEQVRQGLMKIAQSEVASSAKVDQVLARAKQIQEENTYASAKNIAAVEKIIARSEVASSAKVDQVLARAKQIREENTYASAENFAAVKKRLAEYEFAPRLTKVDQVLARAKQIREENTYASAKNVAAVRKMLAQSEVASSARQPSFQVTKSHGVDLSEYIM
jgi:hypothetical protein